MRIPLTLTLFEKPAPEDHELQISWDVAASADVGWARATWNDPGEQTIDDFQIDAVTAVWLTYGGMGSVIVPAEAGTQFGRRESDRTLNWLRAQLPDRDDWLECLSAAAARVAAEYCVPQTTRAGVHSRGMTPYRTKAFVLHTSPEKAAL